MRLLDEIATTLAAGEVLDRGHMEALKEIAGVAGLEATVIIGRNGVEGFYSYNSA